MVTMEYKQSLILVHRRIFFMLPLGLSLLLALSLGSFPLVGMEPPVSPAPNASEQSNKKVTLALLNASLDLSCLTPDPVRPDFTELFRLATDIPDNNAPVPNLAGINASDSNTAQNVSAKDKMGRMAIHYAAMSTSPEIVGILLEKHADTNARTDLTCDTPLHYAALRGNPAIIKELLAAGADPRIQNADRETPLHIIAQNGTRETVTMLLNASADPTTTDCKNQTVLHRAAIHGNLEVFKAIIELSGKKYPEIDIDQQDYMGQTPLHLCATNGSVNSIEIAKILIQMGANQKIEDRHHNWPVNTAIDHDNSAAMIDLLASALHEYREREKKLACLLATATHERLGSSSPLRLLPATLLADIAHKTVLAETRSSYEQQKESPRQQPPLLAERLKSCCTSILSWLNRK